MSTSKTNDHTITRTSENVFFGLAHNAPKTIITDSKTGERAEGLGKDRSQADERAWDRLRSVNEARKR